MRVYELMDILSGCSAGAEVRFRMLTTIEDVMKAEHQEDGGKIYYEIDMAIVEAGEETNGRKEVLSLYA